MTSIDRKWFPPRFDTRRLLGWVLIILFALSAAVWVAPRAGAKAEQWIGAPAVKTRTHALGRPVLVRQPGQPSSSGRLRALSPYVNSPQQIQTLEAGRQFTMLGVLCDRPAAEGDVVVRLRTSDDGADWGPWLETPLDRVEGAAEAPGDATAPGAFTEAVWTDRGRFVQVAARPAADGAPVRLENVRLVTLDTDGGDSLRDRAATLTRQMAATIASVGLASPADAAVDRPALVTRDQWGANESLRSSQPAFAPVKMAFIHHTAGGNQYSRADAPAMVRGIYVYHTKSLGWSDIGYNFLIDRYGKIYVGRYGGPAKGVIGAQCYGFNTGSTGISIMGTFIDQAPPSATITSLQKLLAWKLELHGLSPLGTATMTCGATARFQEGQTVKLPVIAGHRDANFTACPGDAFYAKLPAIRKAVGRLFPPPEITSMTISSRELSPNGDGTLDTVKLRSAISEVATWSVQVVNANGQSIRRYGGEGEAVTVTWDGMKQSGERASDGVYTIKLTATSKYGSVATRTRTVTIDTIAPRMAKASKDRSIFSPNADGWKDAAHLTYSPAEACDVRVSIVDADGVVKRRLAEWATAKTTAARTAGWGGKITVDEKLVNAPDGQYRFRVELRDGVGNTRRMGYPVRVDRTVGFASAAPTTISPNGDQVQDAAKLGFTLTRPAVVTIRIIKDGTTVRTLKPGALSAGPRTVVWNGLTGTGLRAANGRYTVAVAATSAAGSSDVRSPLAVDRYKPRLTSSPGKTILLGQTAKAVLTVDDPHSPEVQRWCVITTGKGKQLSARTFGWLGPGTPSTATWKPATRGNYIFTFTAKDRGGNREYAPARTTITVR